MNNYSNDTNKFRKPQGGSSFRGSDRRSSERPRFGSQNSGPSQMHDAVCADCGGNCKVPFIPSSGKPVYCSNCFEKRGNGDKDSRRPSFSSNKRNFSTPAPRAQENYNKQFEIINSKLDKLFKLLNSNPKISAEVKEAFADLKTDTVQEVVNVDVASVKVAKKKALKDKAKKAQSLQN